MGQFTLFEQTQELPSTQPIQKVFAHCMKLDVAHLSKFSIDSVWGIHTPAKLPSVPFALRRVQIAIERFARLEVHVYCILQFGCLSGGILTVFFNCDN